ncbi:RNA helicase [Ceratobasidium sp. AG-Ba]|nr:RNA helicase [Ceratobasidium sp. AG-Ba]QRW03296.1 RNA helicase [Ceratobasidium sp. AG-Ba]
MNSFTVSTITLPVVIGQGSSIAVQIHFNPHGQRGRFEDRLELVFRKPDNSLFVITRPIKATVGNNDLVTLAPVAPYTRPTQVRQRGTRLQVIEGGEETAPTVRYLRKLEAYNIPEGIRQTLSTGALEQQLEAFRDRLMPGTLGEQSYSQYWSSLVHAEHLQAEIDLRNFDMDDVGLIKQGRLYELEVPGLAEKRPSVLKGDRINIHPHDREEGVWFKGIVHEVLQLAVRISFHPSFPHNARALYDVEFLLNPVPFRRMLQAVKTPSPRIDIILPAAENLNLGDALGDEVDPIHNIYNHLVNTNEEQLQAVKRVTSLPSGSSPFIIFGPPGTGKTMTIVECIAQLLDKPSSRILACAPSNSATDLIAERLINTRDLTPAELFRLNAIWRPRIELPEDLVEYSLHHNTRGFEVPALDKLRSFRVVVCTCSSAALAYARGINPGHFTHIFIDEAGQASEPEVMIPILNLSSRDTNVILSGDPKQLGPVIRSPVARRLGMSTSYLERLMSLPVYDEVTMRGISVAKLLKNFRSHPSILSFPNEQFYGNELVPRAPANITDVFLNWNRLGTQNFPVVFEAIAGEDMRESTSPSFFNPHEASLVKEYVQGLLPLMATTRQIGIVTPYRAQVRKIRQLLREINITDIDIGSVEIFQGQAIRSNQDFLSFDVKHTLGFVANRRRLNVAITRAQALLIIIGDPMVLGLDRLWRRFLYYIYHSGGWKGSPFPWNPDSNPDDEVTSSIAQQEVVQLLQRAETDGADGTDDDVAGVGNE